MFSDASPSLVISGHAFQAFPALDAAPIGTGQHDSTVSWYSNSSFYTVIPSLNLEQFQVYNQPNKKNQNKKPNPNQKSQSQPCLPSLQCVQTSDTHSTVLWKLVYPGLSQINKSTHDDLGWFLLYTAQLHLLQSRVLLLGELKCGKLFDLQK